MGTISIIKRSRIFEVSCSTLSCSICSKEIVGVGSEVSIYQTGESFQRGLVVRSAVACSS